MSGPTRPAVTERVGEAMIRRRKVALTILLAVGAATLFGLGRVTAGHPAGGDGGSGKSYAAGLQAGRAQGVQEGRALQEGLVLPADARDAATAAFDAGYAAGANDIFGGYDGGWSVTVLYLMTLDNGTGGVTYRIASRTVLQPGVDYYLCPDGTSICQQPR